MADRKTYPDLFRMIEQDAGRERSLTDTLYAGPDPDTELELEDVYNGPDPELINRVYAGPEPDEEENEEETPIKILYAGPGMFRKR